MTDSMKFGPEWLRNLSTDSSSVGVGNNNSSNNSSGSTSTSNSGGTHHTSNLNLNHGSTGASSTPRNMFPEFRYGREEMLSLFDKNCNMPEILPLYKKICVEKVQIPLALMPTTEEEISQNTQAPTQRPLWMQRSPLGFSSSGRGLSRGGSVERGRMRGKPVYTTFSRPPTYEEEARPGLLKSERGWFERNGNGGSGDTSVVNSGPSGNSGIGSNSDWNGGGTPHTSPRREFSNHSRNLENWRRNRNDEGAGEPPSEGWRNSSTTHNFGAMQRWARSTSWRDEDGAPNEVQVLPSNSSNIIQRSLSTISTALASGNSMQKNSNGKHSSKSGSTPLSTSRTKNSQWTVENSTRLQDGEDNLPEWATDMPLEGGGSFDATGAFLGSAGDDIRDCREKNVKSATDDSTLNEPYDEFDNKNIFEDKSEKDNCKTDNNLDEQVTETTKTTLKQTDKNCIAITGEQIIEPLTSPEGSDKIESVPTVVDTAFDPQVPQSNQSSQPRQRRLSDHMIDMVDADDMVKKLINDDDVTDIEKPDNVAFASGNNSSIKSVSNLEQSILASQNMHTINSNSNTIGVAPDPKSVMFFYGNMEQTPLQTQPQHQFHTPNLICNESVIPSMATNCGSELWYYRDPQSKVQGPFAALEMTEWYRAGYFNENLLVRRACDTCFRALGDLIKTCQNNMPFTHSTLLATINMEANPMMQAQKDQCDELNNVTAAADTLSAAVKNMSSVDMLHMLNVHFQLLQEQYVRRQEMAILSELAKNEGFHRLSPAEREAVVRQKAQINGLPDYLTSLTNLGNTLVNLNPSAGTQLFNAILECSKKDNHQQIFPQSTPLSSNYMDVGEFILSMQRQQQSRHNHPHQHSSQHQQQQNQHQQQRPCQQALFTGFEGNGRPDTRYDIGNGILEDLNMRMLLTGNNIHNSQPLIPNIVPKAATQDLESNTQGGGFITEQILASNTAQAVSSDTSQSPMLQMWLPSANNNILSAQHSPQVQNQQIPQQQLPQNRWTSGGSLVGLPNVIGTEKLPSEQLNVPSNSAPNSMWVNIKSSQNNDPVPVRDEGEDKKANCEQKSLLTEAIPTFQSKNDCSNTTTRPTNSQYQNDDNVQQADIRLNKNEESVHGIDKQIQQAIKKQKQNTAVNSKSKDDFKKVDSEEKRRQKEERKRLQMEEEKKQLEQERRRQLQEEEDRQKQIQAQRRKALLGNENANSNNLSATQKNYKEPKVQSSSVAPWSAQSVAIPTISSPCLAEIQKAERRERRADQQRQLELLEKQVRLNTAAAIEASEAIPKWNASPVQAKSIAEIQAEEAKKLNAEALFEVQRRKEVELQAALNMVNVNTGGGVSGSTSTWNNVAQSKFWGSNTSSNTVASGFWEEAKNKTNSSSAGTFAAAISGKQQSNNNLQKQQSSGSGSIISSRNLKKSQTVSVMQSTPNSASSVSKIQKGTSNNQHTQSITAPSKQPNNNKAGSTDKKGVASSKNNNSSKDPGSSKDEFENEFINWCTKSLNNMNTKVDVPIFVTFLRDLESPYEVKDYVRIYLGESKEFNDFAKQFLERRSKYKNLQRAQNAHNDDMCKPAPAITPSAGNENSDSKNKQKKLKKNKMTKLDARILGFSVTAAEGRINVGDRDYVDVDK